MSFPTVAGTNTSANSSASTSHTVNLPASIASGDLLIIFIADSIGTANSGFSASGWTALAKCDNGTNHGFQCLYKIASGSEGGSVVVTSAASGKTAHNSYRITGWHGTSPPEQGTPVTGGGGANPDPPSLSPSWGSA